jgi:hypothetical protein
MPPAEKPAPEPTYAPQTKLAVVYFKESVTFGTEMQSASVPVRLKSGDLQRGSNTVDSIEVAGLNTDGSIFIDAEFPPAGLVLRSKVHDLHSGKRIVRQVFVPWSNVKSIGYSE